MNPQEPTYTLKDKIAILEKIVRLQSEIIEAKDDTIRMLTKGLTSGN